MMGYSNEAEKILPKIEKYLTGKILDIGCGERKVVPYAEGVDIRPLDGVGHVMKITPQMEMAFTDRYETVFSSHCLEHVVDDTGVLRAWIQLVKPGGHLVLYLPDAKHYDNRENIEHFQSYEYEVFMRWFKESFPNMTVVEEGPDVGDDKYSFYLVAQKANGGGL